MAVKSYKNEKFLCSEAARNIRILCECTETQQRLQEYGVTATILFFGSARAKSAEQHAAAVAETQAKLDTAVKDRNDKNAESMRGRLEQLGRMRWMCEYYDKIADISRKMTEWSTGEKSKLGRLHRATGVTRYHEIPFVPGSDDEAGNSAATSSGPVIDPLTSNSLDVNDLLLGEGANLEQQGEEVEEDDDAGSGAAAKKEGFALRQAIVVCTGGGPGFMEAAAKGAAQVPNSGNIGMGITLPFEQGLNPFVTPALAFEYHYFFTRKFWMLFHCQALVVAPGGLGTLDELFEVLTLRQTGKVQKDLPVVLIGKHFWESIINWKAIVEFGVLNAGDISDIFITDDVEAACNFLIAKLTFNPPTTRNLPASRSMHSFINSSTGTHGGAAGYGHVAAAAAAAAAGGTAGGSPAK